MDRNDGWSSAVGSDCNPLTLQVLRAVKGLRRPSVELASPRNAGRSLAGGGRRAGVELRLSGALTANGGISRSSPAASRRFREADRLAL